MKSGSNPYATSLALIVLFEFLLARDAITGLLISQMPWHAFGMKATCAAIYVAPIISWKRRYKRWPSLDMPLAMITATLALAMLMLDGVAIVVGFCEH